MTLRHVLALSHPQIPEAGAEAEKIAHTLRDSGVSAASGRLYDPELRRQVKNGQVDMIIALGGDGTMLRAGHLAAPYDVPILGINMGKFGFLAEVHLQVWQELLPRLLQGDYWLEQRMMLRAEQWRAGERLGTWDVLNEIVVSRGSMVRPVHLHASVDGLYLASYVADALIASTATGSTAYALAAGGPILPPGLRNILLVAVAPHLSLDRAIVLPEGAKVSITLETDHQAVLSPDGQAPIGLDNGDQIEAFAGEFTVKFVRFQDPGYFYRNLTPHMSNNPATGNHP
jgi:NAD+ kinase